MKEKSARMTSYLRTSQFLVVLAFVLLGMPFRGQAQLIIPREVPRQGERPAPSSPGSSSQSGAVGSVGVPQPMGRGIVSANILNVRAAPSLTGNVMEALTEGARVDILRTQNEWHMVRTANGKQGWVHGDYVLTGNEYEHALQLMGARRGKLEGTWRGIWEKRKGDRSDSVLHILQADDNTLLVAGTVDKWSCWQVFAGKIQDGEILLRGFTVIKNQRPASEYVLDDLYLKLSPSGLRLEGGWSDAQGSSGKIEYRFSALENTVDPGIWEMLMR